MQYASPRLSTSHVPAAVAPEFSDPSPARARYFHDRSGQARGTGARLVEMANTPIFGLDASLHVPARPPDGVNRCCRK